MLLKLVRVLFSEWFWLLFDCLFIVLVLFWSIVLTDNSVALFVVYWFARFVVELWRIGSVVCLLICCFECGGLFCVACFLLLALVVMVFVCVYTCWLFLLCLCFVSGLLTVVIVLIWYCVCVCVVLWSYSLICFLDFCGIVLGVCLGRWGTCRLSADWNLGSGLTLVVVVFLWFDCVYCWLMGFVVALFALVWFNSVECWLLVYCYCSSVWFVLCLFCYCGILLFTLLVFDCLLSFMVWVLFGWLLFYMVVLFLVLLGCLLFACGLVCWLFCDCLLLGVRVGLLIC